MSKPDAQTVQEMHRWFAVECNNRGWDLVARDDRSEAENREMLQCAYAAALHWSKVGQPVNGARADMLLAHAHAHLDHGDLALHYAKRSLEFCEQNDCEDWDLAFAHAEMTYAAWVAGQTDLSENHVERTRQQAEKIEDAQDREVFDMEFERITKRIKSGTGR